MAFWVFSLYKVMGGTFVYLVYQVNIGWRNVKSGRSYASFGKDCSEVEFIEACSSKLVISLSRIDILRSQSWRCVEEIMYDVAMITCHNVTRMKIYSSYKVKDQCYH